MIWYMQLQTIENRWYMFDGQQQHVQGNCWPMNFGNSLSLSVYNLLLHCLSQPGPQVVGHIKNRHPVILYNLSSHCFFQFWKPIILTSSFFNGIFRYVCTNRNVHQVYQQWLLQTTQCQWTGNWWITSDFYRISDCKSCILYWCISGLASVVISSMCSSFETPVRPPLLS